MWITPLLIVATRQALQVVEIGNHSQGFTH